MRTPRLVALVITLASPVFAQCDGPSVTIRTNADAAAISKCGTYNGDIVIDPSAAGQISLAGISHLKGDLTCYNASQLTGLSFHQLVTISGNFFVTQAPKLSHLALDSIMEVGDIQFANLTALQSLDFATGIITAGQVVVSNTGLKDLSGLDLTACTSLDISDNAALTTINLNGVSNTTNVISIAGNAPGLEVSLAGLTLSRGLTVRNAAAVNVPSLGSLTGAIELDTNSFSSFSAPKLTFAAGVYVFDSPLLNNLSFPLLSEISGGLSILNNSRLAAIDGFPRLQSINGDLNLTGQFASAGFPALSDVQGSLYVYTTIDNSSICDEFNFDKTSGTIHGSNACGTGSQPPPKPPNNGPPSGGGGSGLSAGAIGGIVAGVVVGVAVVFAIGFWWWRRRRTRKARPAPEELDHGKAELPAQSASEPPGTAEYMVPVDHKPLAELRDNAVVELEGSSVPEMESGGASSHG